MVGGGSITNPFAHVSVNRSSVSTSEEDKVLENRFARWRCQSYLQLYRKSQLGWFLGLDG